MCTVIMMENQKAQHPSTHSASTDVQNSGKKKATTFKAVVTTGENRNRVESMGKAVVGFQV